MRRDALIAARKRSGKSQETIAEDVGVDRSTVSNWERGEQTPRPDQRAALAEALGITLTELDGMLSFVPIDNRMPMSLLQYLGMEQSASEIIAYTPHVVDGLLQTPAYAYEIGLSVGVAGMSKEYARRNVEQRATRQARISNGDVRLHSIQSELALRLQLGSPAVMAEQLQHLVDMGERDTITMQIVPFSVGQYEALRMGAISVLAHHFSEVPIIYYRAYSGIAMIEDPEEAANFLAAVEQAQAVALSPDESLAFIAQAAEQWRQMT